ncbi:MAG TPA: plasminogen-binding N-terminal domain-containing protein [Sulfurimonas sp.]|uniref:plasminogen-binding N-terminal domain-containing protein n=1 Tax=Sulfurimonas sp. TaxID=2022749 RepID=UPI002C24DDE7|nr:plasminogen-binding N-terminal domain-containing protein [Sulfurimonas sp.]HUH42549.1 plasminogen-binding N-terminal domain-containing protein [Sulfurimonas sp.]
MKHIFLVFIAVLQLFGATVKSPIIGLNEDLSEVSIKVDNIDVGVSGFVVHEIVKDKRSILANAVVKSFDPVSKIAKISVSEFNSLSSSALPNGKWSIKLGDEVVLAFGYTRGILIAPNEEIYHRITKNSSLQWVHPDLFATMLSFNGHPTPLRSDFLQMSIDNSVGLVFVFLQNKVYTIDAKSFKILAITDAALEQKEAKLPFYTRVQEINAAWWGEGSSRLKEYEPHYYELMIKANSDNKELYDIVKAGGKELQDLLEEFEIKG